MKKKNHIFFLLIMILFSLLSCTPPKEEQVMKVHYIDVGQGDSILIQVNNKNLLIDAGPKESNSTLLSYLDKNNIEKLDYIIATHPHEDHIGNMGDVIEKYDLGEFYSPKVTNTTKSFERMIEELNSKEKKINIIKEGTNTIDLGENTFITIFSPSKSKYEDLNNYSPIMKIQYGETSFLFTGDSEKEVEEYVLKYKEELKSNVIKLGHHGSSSSSSPSFIKEVSPDLAIISCGKDNKYGHPHKETLDTLKKNKIKYYSTAEKGSIVLVSDGNKIKYE